MDAVGQRVERIRLCGVLERGDPGFHGVKGDGLVALVMRVLLT